MKEVWNYLIPDEKFNEKKFQFLDDLYVNVMLGKLILEHINKVTK